MKQNHVSDKPEHQTTPEQAANQLEQTLADYQMALESAYQQLAQCQSDGGVDEHLRRQIEQDAASLRRTSALLKKSQSSAAALADEMTARVQDVQKSVDRKWYKLNPPSNTFIDYAEQKNDHFARGMNGYKLGMIVFIGSFVGVVIELLWCLVTNGYLESRSGLVYGPFNMLYGIGAAALSVLLYRFRNRGRWLSFVGGMLIGSIVEYLCSWLMEVAFGSASWDYSHLPFNLNGRICLAYSVMWGFLGVFWIKDLYPRISSWILKIPNHAGKIVTWVLIIFLAFNCTVSGLAVLRWSERMNGVNARNPYEQFMDARFPDERMERVYANMEFTE